MERKTIKVKIEKTKKDERENVFWVIEELDNLSINLSDDKTEDIENFFNKIFEYIVNEEKLITFELNNNENSLFYEITNEMLSALNSEINSSEENFIKIINLKKQQ